MNEVAKFSSPVQKPRPQHFSKLDDCEHGLVTQLDVADEKLLYRWTKRQLHDADEECELLLSRFREITEPDYFKVSKDEAAHHEMKQKEFVLITGRSGTGKSTLALILKDAVEEQGGFFLRGKFDQLQEQAPCKPFVHAITEWVHQILHQTEPQVVPSARYHHRTGLNNGGSTDSRNPLCSSTGLNYIPLPDAARCPSIFLATQDVEVLKRNIISSLGSEVHVLIQMIPALSELLEMQLDDSRFLSGSDSCQRLFRLFRRFFRAVRESIDAPFVLFLDDLQWADQESLDLVVALLAADDDEKYIPDRTNLMIFGACRDNEVSLDHMLSCTLRLMEDIHDIVVTQIHLNNLRLETVCSLVSDTLHLSPQHAAPLARQIFNCTHGNGFSTMQILQVLWDGVAAKNNGLEEKNGDLGEGNRTYADFSTLGSKESLDSSLIAEKVASQKLSYLITRRNGSLTQEIDPLHILRQRITLLPLELQNVLKTMACLGAEVEKFIVIMALEDPTNGNQYLREAEQTGLIEFLPTHVTGDSLCRSRLCFSHDNVQEASYNLIPSASKHIFHVTIGRRLWKALLDAESNELATIGGCSTPSCLPLNDLRLLVLNQLLRGKEVLKDEEERVAVAYLCLRVGAQLGKAASFRVAASYLEHAIDFLPRSCWDLHAQIYDVTLEIYSVAAEVQYSVGNYARSDDLVTEILANARSREDAISAYTTRMYSLGSRHQLLEAVETGQFILEVLGESIPRCTGPIQLLLSLKRTQRMLRRYRRGNSRIMHLPMMEDQKKLAAMRILNLMFTYAFSARPEVAILVTNRLIQLTLKHGLSAMSAPGFGMYAMVLRLLFNNYEQARQYGLLATQLLEKFSANEWIPRVYAAVYGMANTNCLPLQTCMEKSLLAYRIGLTSGDIEFSMMSLMLSAHTRFFVSREPLHTLRRDFDKEWNIMTSSKQENVAIFQAVVAQTVYNLVEQTNDPITLTGKYLVEEEAVSLAKLQGNDSFLVVVFVYKGYLAYLYRDYERGEEDFIYARSLNFGGTATVIRYYIEFMEGLTCLALSRHQSSCKGRRRRRKRMRVARRCFQTLKRYAQHCPTDLNHRVSFFEAEFALLQGNLQQALAHYDTAYEASLKEGFLNDSAMILERKALTLRENGREIEGNLVLRDACALYSKWGAKVKVNEIESMLNTA